MGAGYEYSPQSALAIDRLLETHFPVNAALAARARTGRRKGASRWQWTCDGVGGARSKRSLPPSNWAVARGDKLRRAFLASQVVCFVYDDDILIGVAALTDGEYRADSRRGRAPRLPARRHRLGDDGAPAGAVSVWRAMLVADDDVQILHSPWLCAPHSGHGVFDWDNLYDAPDARPIPALCRP